MALNSPANTTGAIDIKHPHQICSLNSRNITPWTAKSPVIHLLNVAVCNFIHHNIVFLS